MDAEGLCIHKIKIDLPPDPGPVSPFLLLKTKSRTVKCGRLSSQAATAGGTGLAAAVGAPHKAGRLTYHLTTGVTVLAPPVASAGPVIRCYIWLTGEMWGS